MEAGSGPPRPFYVTEKTLSDFVASALHEDTGEGDHSTLGAVPESSNSKAQLIIKDTGVLAGVALAEVVYTQYDPRLKIVKRKADGAKIAIDDIAFTIEGPSRSILSTERLVLNCMQRMSGIATYTNHLSRLIAGTEAKLMDTRKTTPNFRMLEKWAVVIGGGNNHRFALYDMVMLKDNHVDMAGGVRQAIESSKKYLSTVTKKLKIEIETRTIEEVKEVLDVGGVDVIMLDNMSLSDMKSAVNLIGGKYKTEASGGITEANIRDVAKCGVDYISVGALTHSVRSLDMSLKVMKGPQ